MLGRSRLACRLVPCVSPGVSFSSRVRPVVMRFRLVLVRFLSHLLIRPCRAHFFSSSRHHAARLGVLFRQGRRGVASRAEAVVFFSFSLIDVLGRSRSVISSSVSPRRRFMPRSRPGHRLARLIVSSPRFLIPVMMRKARSGNAGGAKHLAIADDRMSDRTGRRGVEDKQATRTTRRPYETE